MRFRMTDWLKEVYRRHAGVEGVSESFRRVRRVHEMALLAWIAILFDFGTFELCKKLIDLAGLREYRKEIMIWFFFISATVCFLAGLILVYRHRSSEKFLPWRSLITYLAAAIAWQIGVYEFLEDVLHIDSIRGMYPFIWNPWFGGSIAMIVPHLLWRRAKLTPLFLDAVLMVAVWYLAIDLLWFYTGEYSQMIYPWGFGWYEQDVFFLKVILGNWALLVILRKKSRFWKYPAAVVLNSVLFIVLYMFPRLGR